MDKITHEVHKEQWLAIMEECLSSGKPKTTWCRENGISDKQFFYWQRVLRKEAYLERSKNTAEVATFSELESTPEALKYLKGKYPDGKIPSLKSLKEKREQLEIEKLAKTNTYHYFQEYQKELRTVCQNVDTILNQSISQQKEISHDRT